MLRQIAPVFFTRDIPATLAYYTGKLGFACLGTWPTALSLNDPPVYAIVARDQQVIHFRCAEPPTANPDKYADELLDAYLFVEDVDALYAEYATQGVEFARGLGNMPWHTRVRGEGLRWPSAGFRRESVIFFRRRGLLVHILQ
jgi:catechol 2,3-dioxygenase-like lactoylglutathione lyase family enzyme